MASLIARLPPGHEFDTMHFHIYFVKLQTLTIERIVNEIICRVYTLILHKVFWWVLAHQKQNRAGFHVRGLRGLAGYCTGTCSPPQSPTSTMEKVNEIICRAYTLTLHEAFWWILTHQKQNLEARGPKRTISCMRVGWGITYFIWNKIKVALII